MGVRQSEAGQWQVGGRGGAPTVKGTPASLSLPIDVLTWGWTSDLLVLRRPC